MMLALNYLLVLPVLAFRIIFGDAEVSLDGVSFLDSHQMKAEIRLNCPERKGTGDSLDPDCRSLL